MCLHPEHRVKEKKEIQTGLHPEHRVKEKKEIPTYAYTVSTECRRRKQFTHLTAGLLLPQMKNS